MGPICSGRRKIGNGRAMIASSAPAKFSHNLSHLLDTIKKKYCSSIGLRSAAGDLILGQDHQLGFVSFFHQLFEVTGNRETRFAAGIVERSEPCSGQTLEAVAVAVDTTV